MQSQTLQQTDDQTDSIGTGKFEVGRRGEFGVYFYDLLQQNSDGAYRMPQ